MIVGTLYVSVGVGDIVNGITFSDTRCPVSLAIRRALYHRGYSYVGVATYTNVVLLYPDKTIKNPKHFSMLKLPPPAINFLRAFDLKQAVKPFGFLLDLTLATDYSI